MERLEGSVGRVIFRDPDGYSVLELQVEGRSLPVTITGSLVDVQSGERLAVTGRWTTHPRFGEQFRVDAYDAVMPTSVEGLTRYLASGVIDGIGPALAERLVQHFGEALFDVAEKQPGRLTEVDGIGQKRAASLGAALVEQRAMREIIVFLRGLGVGPALAARIYQTWGEDCISRVRSDPYRLVRDVEGVGFATADGIAKALGVAHDSPSRMAAGVLHVLRQGTDFGHTVVVREDLINETAHFLDADASAVEQALDGLVAEKYAQLREPLTDEGPIVVVGPSSLVRAEDAIAEALAGFLGRPPLAFPERLVESVAQISLTDEQRRAVSVAAQGPVAIITGGPGTGKTTVLRTLVHLLDRLSRRVFLCAPTGRAAKRLAEATDRQAATIHRLLGYGGGQFDFNQHNPLPSGVVIVDEASMVDVYLMRSLVAAIGDDSALVLVGDQDQLPSVGPGNVLGDLIGSDAVPLVRLTTVFRQAQESRIVTNAHRIRRGVLPEPSATGASDSGDFHVVKVDNPVQAQQRVLQVCCERIPQAYGLDPLADVQVLSPMHRGEVGTVALNQALQAALNPSGQGIKRVTGETLRVGDKVMQVRNDYDRDVFNGDIGRVTAVDLEQGSVLVEINGASVAYTSEQLGQLALAYCVSIHKSQGSEYPAVVVPLLTQHYVLLQRNLLYTAVTRARQLVVLVGSDRALSLAVSRADQAQRRTLLAYQLMRQLGI
ncbi:MAG: ATP-dependent RecD-like DNA helicase [Deltaproteobacteria bacterium]|nr:ATP-dependent RecD-like DNA helicase [Deltaproteobacteria bacterium]